MRVDDFLLFFEIFFSLLQKLTDVGNLSCGEMDGNYGISLKFKHKWDQENPFATLLSVT